MDEKIITTKDEKVITPLKRGFIDITDEKIIFNYFDNSDNLIYENELHAIWNGFIFTLNNGVLIITNPILNIKINSNIITEAIKSPYPLKSQLNPKKLFHDNMITKIDDIININNTTFIIKLVIKSKHDRHNLYGYLVCEIKNNEIKQIDDLFYTDYESKVYFVDGYYIVAYKFIYNGDKTFEIWKRSDKIVTSRIIKTKYIKGENHMINNKLFIMDEDSDNFYLMNESDITIKTIYTKTVLFHPRYSNKYDFEKGSINRVSVKNYNPIIINEKEYIEYIGEDNFIYIAIKGNNKETKQLTELNNYLKTDSDIEYSLFRRGKCEDNIIILLYRYFYADDNPDITNFFLFFDRKSLKFLKKEKQGDDDVPFPKLF